MIRPLERRDRESYLAMAREFYDSPAVDHSVPDVHLERTFDALMDGTPYADCYLFEEADRIVGYALLARTWSQEAGGETLWIEELYLRPGYRGKGLGQQFFAWLKEREHPARFRLEAEPENERAKALYRRQGFRFLNYESFIFGE